MRHCSAHDDIAKREVVRQARFKGRVSYECAAFVAVDLYGISVLGRITNRRFKKLRIFRVRRKLAQAVLSSFSAATELLGYRVTIDFDGSRLLILIHLSNVAVPPDQRAAFERDIR